MNRFTQSVLLVSALFITPAAFGQGRLIGINGTGVYEVSMTTGATTLISTLAPNPGTIGGLAHDWANNITYMISSQNQNLMSLNANTGSWSTIGTFGLATNPIMQGLEYNPDNGHLYGHSAGSSHGFFLYDVNTSNGAATNLGTSSLTSFHNLGYDSINHVMYMTNSSTDSLYTLNLTNNVSTLVGALGTSTNPNGLAFNRDTGVMYMIDNNTDNLYTLNLQTGAATVVGSLGAATNMLALAYVPIPGPGGLALFAVAGLIGSRRRR